MENKGTQVLKILDGLKKEYCAKYGAAIFEVYPKETAGGIELSGQVLIENQKNDILSAIEKSGLKAQGENIKIISDPREKLEKGWGEIKDGIVDVFGKYLPGETATLRALDKFRATQLEKGDVVRVLAEKEGQILIQPEDLTLGWIKRSQIFSGTRENSIEKWQSKTRAQKNKLFKADPPNKAETEKFIKRFLDVPYLLGGTTAKGIDCSSLVQKMYQDIFGILMPRHSEDQAKCGVPVRGLKEAKIYDLIFLKLKNNGHYHIGVIVDIGPEKEKNDLNNIRIFNARLNNGGVVIQGLDEILKDYELLDIRRIIEF